jgi:putative membrane protein
VGGHPGGPIKESQVFEAPSREGGEPEKSTDPIGGRSFLAIYVFTVPALLGYWYYGLHPERLAGSELALRFYPLSFGLFAQLHIVVAAAVLFVALYKTLRLSWLPALVAVGVLSFTAEHIGTGYGFPFGGYSYTGLLGMKIGPRVPALIPVSWFLMALPAWILARKAFPASAQRLQRVFLGAVWLVVWDLALDPAMSFLTPYWQWEEVGSYYGMPWVNLLGWLGTGLVLMVALDLMATRIAFWRLGSSWSAGYYLAVLSMPLGMLVAAGAWGAVATASLAVVASLTITWSKEGRHSLSQRSAPAPQALEA